MLQKVVRAGFRVRLKKNEPFISEIEYENYKKIEKGWRRTNIDLYWEIQTQVENETIGSLTRSLPPLPAPHLQQQAPEAPGQRRPALVPGPQHNLSEPDPRRSAQPGA